MHALAVVAWPYLRSYCYSCGDGHGDGGGVSHYWMALTADEILMRCQKNLLACNLPILWPEMGSRAYSTIIQVLQMLLNPKVRKGRREKEREGLASKEKSDSRIPMRLTPCLEFMIFFFLSLDSGHLSKIAKNSSVSFSNSSIVTSPSMYVNHSFL